MRKLKVHMVLMELFFLVVVLGGSVLLFAAFGTTFYSNHKAQSIQNAFDDIKEEDIAKLNEENYDMLQSYEMEGLDFIIADDEFNVIYMTRELDSERVIRRTIIENLNKYSENPDVITRDSRNSTTIKLRGIVKQEYRTYYICIRENLNTAESSFTYTEKFMMILVLISLLLGSIVMYWQSRRIAKPIENIAEVSKQMAKRDFSVRADENVKFEEAAVLAKNFNTMAGQLSSHIESLEANNDKLEAANGYLADQNDQKFRMEQARKEFLANISHELKTPLAVISSQVEMIECMGDKIDKEYYFASIKEEIQKMNEMISNLLKLSFMEHNLEKMERTELNLSDVLEYLQIKYEALFQKKHLKVQLMIEPDCEICGNREYMEQAINNYILNAFEHTGEGRNVMISLKKEEGQVVLRVFNEGEKLKLESKYKIWESYYQKHSKKDDGENNAGLGLYIVKTIINIHGGTYGVENREKGVEFWFTIPELEV